MPIIDRGSYKLLKFDIYLIMGSSDISKGLNQDCFKKDYEMAIMRFPKEMYLSALKDH